MCVCILLSLLPAFSSFLFLSLLPDSVSPESLNTKLHFYSKEHWYTFAEWYLCLFLYNTYYTRSTGSNLRMVRPSGQW